MDLSMRRDVSGGLLCTLNDGEAEVMVTASAAFEAAHDLAAALDESTTEPFAECLWLVPGGEYRWMFRRQGERLTVVVLWSAGTVPGWQHVFRAECDAAWFTDRTRRELAGLGLAAGGA
jgi:hypothetical protein